MPADEDEQALALWIDPHNIFHRRAHDHYQVHYHHSHRHDIARNAVAGAHNVHIGAVADDADDHADVAPQGHILQSPCFQCLILHTANSQVGVMGEDRCVGAGADADADEECGTGYEEAAPLAGAADRMHQVNSRYGIHEIRDGHDEKLTLVVLLMALMAVVPHDVADADSVQSCVAAEQLVNLGQLQVFWLDCQLRQRQMEYPASCQLS